MLHNVPGHSYRESKKVLAHYIELNLMELRIIYYPCYNKGLFPLLAGMEPLDAATFFFFMVGNDRIKGSLTFGGVSNIQPPWLIMISYFSKCSCKSREPFSDNLIEQMWTEHFLKHGSFLFILCNVSFTTKHVRSICTGFVGYLGLYLVLMNIEQWE